MSIRSLLEILTIIKKAYSLADKVAKTDANVLILGENGTGKYVMANYIHQQSERKNNTFMAVDLGSLSDSIFESELVWLCKRCIYRCKKRHCWKI